MKFFAKNLQYLETPQYLRKLIFPIQPDLKFAGLQSPLDAPHHVRFREDFLTVPYREGVTIEERHYPKSTKYNGGVLQHKDATGIYVCCGLAGVSIISPKLALKKVTNKSRGRGLL